MPISVPHFSWVPAKQFCRPKSHQRCREGCLQFDALGGSSLPLGYLVAGPLADCIFEPLAKGLLAGSIGQIIGTGTGRGIGLLFAIARAMVMLTTVAGYQYHRLQLLEDDLPDVIAGEPAAKTQ